MNLAMFFCVFGDAILPVGENGQDFVAFAGALFQRINITLGVFAKLNVFANKLLFPFVCSGAHSVPCVVDRPRDGIPDSACLQSASLSPLT